MFLLFDIGASNLRIAVSNTGLKLDRILMAPTPKKYSQGLRVIKELGQEITQGHKPKFICAGIASILWKDKSKIRNFIQTDWEGKNLAKDLEKIFGCKVVLENDSALAGLGEATYGAGKHNNIIAYLTFSTGVGGARIINNTIDTSANSFEPRLQLVSDNMTQLGRLASGHAIEKKYGQSPEKLQNPKAWTEIEKWITVGINNAIVFWSPEVLVLGGPIVNNKNISIPRITKFLKTNLDLYEKIPQLVKAELGQQSGLYGALKLVKK